MDRQERIKKVGEFIDIYGNREFNFDILYAKLLEEFEHEVNFNPDHNTNHYLNNLKLTRDVHAEAYIEAKKRKPNEGASFEFRDFVSRFRRNVIEANHQ
ncbi:MAG TPA: hypothetical protein VMH01_00690 [Puia sp.]|nr:hypothetical protein [Puia sp.]